MKFVTDFSYNLSPCNFLSHELRQVFFEYASVSMQNVASIMSPKITQKVPTHQFCQHNLKHDGYFHDRTL
jgi:hypothetical protein